FSQSLLPSVFLNSISQKFETFGAQKLMELISIIAGVFILIFTIHISILKKTHNRFIPLFCLFWLIFNSLIFSFSPETKGIVFTVDSRNLYFTSVGICILIVYMADLFSKRNKLKFAIVMLFVLSFNFYFLKLNLSKLAEVGVARKKILDQIMDEHPLLPDQTIFYIESDTSFYGLPIQIRTLPFQSGFGQTLLSWYEESKNFPADFFTDRFLWDIDSQGYKRVDGTGFGYFRDFSDLLNFYNKTQEKNVSIIAYSFNS